MKKIEIDDETYDFLMDLSKELNTQDHRCTAMPYFFQIQEEKECPTGDGMGDLVWVCDGEICLRDDDDIKKAVFEWKNWDMEDYADQNKFEKLDEFDIERILSENYSKHYVTTQMVYHNAFLTEKACQEHIARNGYHYTQPRDFLTHAFRNPELEKLMSFVCKLTGGEIHK